MLLSGMRESGSDVVEIDSDPVLFRFILDYLYGVSIEVPSSLIVPLLGLCSCYSMIGMRDKLAEMLGQHLCIENCCSIFAAAGREVFEFLCILLYYRLSYATTDWWLTEDVSSWIRCIWLRSSLQSGTRHSLLQFCCCREDCRIYWAQPGSHRVSSFLCRKLSMA